MRNLKKLLGILLILSIMTGVFGVAEEPGGETGSPDPGTEEEFIEPQTEQGSDEDGTAEPTAEPETENTAEPTAEPETENTAEPTAEPETENTAEPTAEPETENTAEPTAEPEAENTAEPTAEPAAEPEALSCMTSVTLGVKEKFTLPVDYTGEGTLTFKTSKKSVATVSTDGLITAKAAGTAVITVKTETGLSAKCKVTVKTAVSKVKLSKSGVSLGVHEQLQLTAKLTGTSYARTWSSSDEEVAAVEDGLITAKAEGTAVIRLTAFNGKYAKCTVTVCAEPEDLTVAAEEITIGVKQTFSIGPVLLPEDAAGAITYVSDNPAAAKVSGGKITGVAPGTANITVHVYNNIEKTIAVTVKKAPSKVSLNAKSRTLGIGETFSLVPSVAEDCATKYSFSTSSKSVATVSSDGVATGKKAGTATITVKTHNGKKATCKITVKKKPSSLTLPESVILGEEQTTKLKAVFKPSGSFGNITWTTSDPAVATVENGTVTAHETGTAVIRADSYNGLFAECLVEVKAAPTAIFLPETDAVGIGEKYTLRPATDAGEGVDPGFKWQTSKKAYATVSSSGTVKGIKKGTTVITVTAYNGVSATCTVKVLKAPSKVTLSEKALTLEVEETALLTASLPSGTASHITWSSSNKAVATVDPGTGVITAVAAGKATVTAKTFNGKKATCTVTVTGRIERQGDFKFVYNAAETAVILRAYYGSDASVTVPETVNGVPVTEIGTGAFAGNTALTAIDLPDSIEKIADNAFAGCVNLRRMH